jgi:tRNA uridine 5-carboxymethylaminomethyl modification enzyme
MRLTPAGRELGIVNDTRWRIFEAKRNAVEKEQNRLESIVVHARKLSSGDEEVLGGDFRHECRPSDLLRRPDFNYRRVTSISTVGGGEWRDGFSEEQIEQVELQLEVRAKYAGYIERQQREIEKHAKQERLPLPEDIDYAAVTGLSTEARQRLTKARPTTLGHASRLEGVTPATVSLLLIHLKKRLLQKTA